MGAAALLPGHHQKEKSMPQSQPGGESRLNSRSIRDHNLSLVLHELARTRGCSRSRLRETTGLTPGAVTLLVNELIDAGMIETSDTMRAEGGRRKNSLRSPGIPIPSRWWSCGATASPPPSRRLVGRA